MESIPALETGKQLQGDYINRKHVSRRDTLKRTNNNAIHSNRNQSLLRTSQANGNLINVRITDKEVHADLVSNQTFPPFVEARFKKNISNYETIDGKVNSALNPWCSISINLLVGNNITIQKFLLQPSENYSIGKPLELYDKIKVVKDEIELSATNESPHIPKSNIVNNSTGNFSNGVDTFEGVKSRRIENNVPTPFNALLLGLTQSSIAEKREETFQTKDADLTTGNSFSALQMHNESTIASFNLEPSHYDDVDPSGVDIGWPITFFPPEICSDTITNAYTNKGAHANICTVNRSAQKGQKSGSLTTSKAVYYDDVDPSGIEIGSPITFFPPENCNETIACVDPNFVNSSENQ